MYCFFKGDLIFKSNASYSDDEAKKRQRENAG